MTVYFVSCRRTLVLGLACNLGEKFEEVWQIIADEFRANDQVLS